MRALLITTLAFNLFGDGVRDALDPRVDRLIGEVSARMVRFLIVRTLTGLLVLWLITHDGVRAVLRGAEQRRAHPGWTTGHTGDHRRDQRNASASTSRCGSSTPSFVGDALHGDLGYDYYHQVPVTTIIAQAVPDDPLAGGGSGGDLAGARASTTVSSRPRTRARWQTEALTAFALFFYSMPSFLLGLLLLYFLYFQLTQAGLRLVPTRWVRAR